MKKWKLNNWKNYPVKHIPEYEDQKELDLVLKKIQGFPPLVFAGETRSLKKIWEMYVKEKLFFYKEETAQKVLQSFIQII